MAFHITSRLANSTNLIPTVAAARRLSSQLLRFDPEYRLVLFSCAGDHLHTVALTDRRKAGRLTRALEGAITRACGHDPGFRPGQIQPVWSVEHLEELVHYSLGQHAKHGTAGDPLLESSNLLDLLSIRLVNTSCAELLERQPFDLRDSSLARYIGGMPSPGTDASRLRDACAVVTGGQRFDGRTALATRARRAAIRISRNLGCNARTTAALLGVSTTTVSVASGLADPPMDQALLLALGLVQRHPSRALHGDIQLPETVTWNRRSGHYVNPQASVLRPMRA